MIEIYLNNINQDSIQKIAENKLSSLDIFVPLESIGFTNSYFDICDDVLEAVWACEKLAAHSQQVKGVLVQKEKHNSYYRLSIINPLEGFSEALNDCIILYRRCDDDICSEEPQDYQNVIKEVMLFENNLDNFSSKVPDLLDAYYANLVGGKYQSMASDAPEEYKSEISKYPERGLGYWVSAYSEIIGSRCLASSDSWVIPKNVNLNDFFEITGQKYDFSKFVKASVLVLNGASYAASELIISFFPMRHYFKGRVCSSIELAKDEYLWPPDPFDWSSATFTISPYTNRVRELIGEDSSLLAPAPGSEHCYVDLNGTLIIVDDGEFNHILYDTSELNLTQIKTLNSNLADALQSTGQNIGFSDQLNFDWSSIDDDEFEKLCYDIIYSHPRFDSDTIRKLGKSRSRDGGRDIQVYDKPNMRNSAPKKWIFQCKLVTGKGSLSASKLIDVGDMLDMYEAQGFGVFTNTTIDATLYDKLDAICKGRGIFQFNFSGLELEKELIRKPFIRNKYFHLRKS